jgi:uncharacterized membrane-anchored protein
MCTSFEPLCCKVSLKSVAVFVLLPIFVFLGISRSDAQQSSLLSLATPDQGQVSWTPGPADASLGTLADIKIPKSYRFTDAAGAGLLLAKMNNPIPEGLVGILAPESGEWWVVLTYKDVGYIKGVDKDRIVAAAILKTISDRAQRQNESRRLHGLPSITSVDWALSPTYDATTHAVEWAVRAKAQSSEVINHTVRLLGREGVLDATAVAPYQKSRDTSAAIPLKELMRNISFKQGQRYADHQEGDKVSNIGLAGVITGDDDTATAQNDEVAASGKSAGGWVWYVLAGVVVGGTFMLVRGVVHRHHKTHRVPSSGSVVSNAMSNGNAIGNGNGHVHAPVEVVSPTPALTGSLSAGEPAQVDLKPKMAVAQNGSNESTHRRNARRKKIFDYHRFYTDTVMKLSASGYTVEVPPRNGHTNGHANGHSSDLTSEAKSASYGTMNQTIMQSHLELIANQKALIEEQKRLVQQQTRFIEEKNKLIQEQNALLERQSAMIENQYSLKLESES